MENRLTTAQAGGEVALLDTQESLLEARLNKAKYPRLHSYTRQDAVYRMTKIVSEAYLYTGKPIVPEEIDFTATALVDELTTTGRPYGADQLSFAEIRTIVKRAILGGSEMFGVNVASLYKVIIAYVKGEGHELDKQARTIAAEAKINASVQNKINEYASRMIKNN